MNACYAQGNGFDIWDEMCTDNAHSHKPWEGPYESIQQSELSTAEDRGYNLSLIHIYKEAISPYFIYENDVNIAFRYHMNGVGPVSYTHLDVYKRQGSA